MLTHNLHSLGFVVPVLLLVSLLTGCSQESVSQVDVMDRPAESYLGSSEIRGEWGDPWGSGIHR